jgi:hypothetical protein
MLRAKRVSPAISNFSAGKYRQTLPSLWPGQAIPATDSAFIDFWASQYRYDLEHLYESNISVKPFTNDAVMKLYEWKNQRKLSERKEKSVERNYISNKEHDCVRRAVEFSPSASAEEAVGFAKEFLGDGFPEGGAIWRIFWLHCCNQGFPIYDQHVHRAMVFIEEGRIEELDGFSERNVVDSYLTKYLKFHRQFSEEQRRIDKALVTFGSFLKAWPGFFSRIDIN